MAGKYILLLTMMSWVLTGSSLFGQKAYFLQDYQYFRPMIADIRVPQNHIRVYRADAVEFCNSTSSGLHGFVDASFGEYFPLLGYNFENEDDPETAPLRIPGIALFVDGSSHLLIDLNTVSSDIINNDYRVGAGAALRFPKLKFLSLRYRFFHESTHLGDEYTLYASTDTSFRRYNVSYEAHEVYTSIDVCRKNIFSYVRGYFGFRRLNRTQFPGFTGGFAPSDSFQFETKNELQTGAEIYLQGSSHPQERPERIWLARWLAFQNIVIAVDFYQQNKYSIREPQKGWNRNFVVGLVYGDPFGLINGRTVRWQLNYYDGVNPHGQFRKGRLNYWGFDYIIDF